MDVEIQTQGSTKQVWTSSVVDIRASEDAAETKQLASTSDTKRSSSCRWKKAAKATAFFLRMLLILALGFPLSILCGGVLLALAILHLSFTGNLPGTFTTRAAGSEKPGGKKATSPYKWNRRQEMQERRMETITQVSVIWPTRIGVMVLCWLILNLSVPRLRPVHFLGSLLWKWSVLLTVVFLLIPAMFLGFFIADALLERYTDWHPDDPNFFLSIKDYVTTGAVGRSVRLVAYFAAIVLVWIIYFLATLEEINSRSGIKHSLFQRIHEYIIFTLFSLLVGAALDLARNLVVLWWKARRIYSPAEKAQILLAAFRLYLLLLVFGDLNKEPDRVWWTPMPYYSHQKRSGVLPPEEQDPRPAGTSKPIEAFMKEISEVVSLSNMNEAATWLTKSLDLTSHEIPEDLDSHDLQRVLDKYCRDCTDLTANGLAGDDILKERATFLLQLMRLDLNKSPTDPPIASCYEFEEWMKSAHRSCFVYMNRLHGSLESANILSKVLLAFEIFSTVIFWLFITKLATTNVMLTLGSLFIGVAVLFGDTCKAAFQGFVFSFVARPFEVGDQLEIDSAKVEVKRIYFFTTVLREIIIRESEKGEDDDTTRTKIFLNSNLPNAKITKLGKIKRETAHNVPKSADPCQVIQSVRT